MHKTKIAGLLVSLVLCYGGSALAQEGGVGGPESRSNSGVALRGLDRAGEAAREHGIDGRARASQRGDNRYNEHPSANMGQSQSSGHGMGGVTVLDRLAWAVVVVPAVITAVAAVAAMAGTK